MISALAITSSLILTNQLALAGSATWKLAPTSGQWAEANNWTPTTVPNGAADVATFDVSNTTAISVDTEIQVNSIVFNPGASAFTITRQPGASILTISGVGVTNNSGIEQNFVALGNSSWPGEINFTNGANAGQQTVYTIPTVKRGNGTTMEFFDTASAGSATFVLGRPARGGNGSGQVYFSGSSTAGNATFVNSGFVNFFDNSTAADALFMNNEGKVEFDDTASAGNAVMTSGGFSFYDSSTAANGSFTLQGGSQSGFSGELAFFGGAATAGNGLFFLGGGTAENTTGALAQFNGSATAGDGTFTLGGGTIAGAGGAIADFDSGSSEICTAANATFVANGGVNGGGGAQIQFRNTARGGTCRIELHGNASLDISLRDHSPTVHIGALEGEGLVFLGAYTLETGNNNLDTTFSGILQDEGGVGGGTNGSLSKAGNGTLTLTSANTYTGGTTINQGALVVSNTIGSGTGTGALSVTNGTLGGKGIIAGAVTVGTGSGSGAFLVPAFGSRKQVTLTLQSSLTLQADATYTCTFKAKNSRAKTDRIVANGVTVNGGANIALSGTVQGQLQSGLVLTLISNTSTNPINGTFSNLADGAIVNVNGTNFQASYEGGDGNDLTLTVIP